MDIKLMNNILSIAQKETWRTSFDLIEPSVRQAVEALDAPALSHLVFIGNGSSLYAGFYGAMLMEHVCHLPTTLHEGANSLYIPEAILKNALVVGLSNSGESPTVCDGIRRAKAMGAKTMAVSGNDAGTLAALSDISIAFNGQTDDVPTKTKSYIETLVTLTLFAGELAKARGLPYDEGFAADFEACRTEVEKIIASAETVLKPLAERYTDCPSFTILGSGWNMATVHEGSLKVTEIGWIDSSGFELENYMHGRFRGCSPKIPFIIIAPKGQSFLYDANFLALAKRKGIDTIVLTDETDRSLAELATHIIPIGPLPERLTPFVYPVALYLFALYLGLSHGKETPSDRGGDPQAQKVPGEEIVPGLKAYFERLKGEAP